MTTASESMETPPTAQPPDEELVSARIEDELAHDVERGPIDLVLLSVVAILVGVGLLVVYTGSSVEAARRLGDDFYYVKQQMLGAALGVVALAVTTRLDYRWYREHAVKIYLFTVFLLLLTYVPGIGVEVNGARRWINLGVMRFQPAELAKLTICIFMAYSMEKRADVIQKLGPFLRQAVPVGLLLAPLFFQPDFGSTLIVCALAAVMLLMGGIHWLHGLSTVAVIVAAGVPALLLESYRQARIQTWLDPWSDYAGTSYQLINGWVALANGGLTGTGFGRGNAIFGYIPEMYNDWAAALVGEEFGFIGFFVFVGLYAVLGWRGYRAAFRCGDRFGALLAFGLTTLILGQAAFNFGVIVGVLPTKGLTLPFVSFGRSSLLMMLVAAGILLNISQNNPDLRSYDLDLRRLLDRVRRRKEGEAQWRDERIKDIRQTTGRNG